MKNLLKVSALAVVFAAGLASCESKPAETTTTETTTTETAPMMADSTGTMDGAAPMTADSTTTMSTTTTAQ